MTEARFHAETAGALLRAAREKQGLHISALAAAIKVSPRKLDALENDRWDELPDATFTRALAQTVCRSLKIDAAPVLERLPTVERPALDSVVGNLNMPFKDGAGGTGLGSLTRAIRPMVWAGLLLLVAAAVVYVLPDSVWPTTDPTAAGVTGAAKAPSTAVVAAPAVTGSLVAPIPASTTLSSSAAGPASSLAVAQPARPPAPAPVSPLVVRPGVAPAVAVAAAPLPGQTPALQLRALQASWVEARDARGRVLLSRVMSSGESLPLDGQMPIRLTVGNAIGTQVTLRGKPVDLGPQTRDNVARIELQ